MHGSYSGAEGDCHRAAIFSPCPNPRLCLYSRSVTWGITLSTLAVQPKRGTCSTSRGVSLTAYHRSHQQQHFYLFSAVPPHSFQSLKRSNSFSKEFTNQHKNVHLTSSAEVPRTGSASSQNSTGDVFQTSSLHSCYLGLT